MTSRRRIAGRVAAWTTAATLVVGGTAAGVAFAASPGSTTTTGTTTTAQTAPQHKAANGAPHKGMKGHRPRGLEQRALYGEFTVRGRNHTYTTVDLRKGQVSAVSPTSITVTSLDKTSGTFVVNSATKVRKNGAKATINDVKVGDRVVVMGTRSGNTLTAKAIVVPKARPAGAKKPGGTSSTAPSPTG